MGLLIIKREEGYFVNAYKVLTLDEAVNYIRKYTDIFSIDDNLVAKQVSGNNPSADGYVNVIIGIQSTKDNKSVILKQMMPYVTSSIREVYKLIPLERIKAEVDSIKFWDTICPNSVPKIYVWDDRNKIIIMEDLSRLKIMSSELLKRKKFPELPKQLGEFLGKTAFYTSDLFLTYKEKRKLKNRFTTCNMKYLWDDFMFTGAILDNSNYHININIKDDIHSFCNNSKIRQEVIRLRDIYTTNMQCLIHSDLHTSNIFVDRSEMKVFDTEYATYGPISFDIGRILGSIVLNYASLLGLGDIAEQDKKDYQEYLLQMIEEIYQEFSHAFHKAWLRHSNHKDYQTYYNQFYRKTILQETIGFLACSSISRIYDEGLPFDFKRMDDLNQRAIGQKFIIKLAEQLLLDGKKINKIEELTGVIRAL